MSSGRCIACSSPAYLERDLSSCYPAPNGGILRRTQFLSGLFQGVLTLCVACGSDIGLSQNGQDTEDAGTTAPGVQTGDQAYTGTNDSASGGAEAVEPPLVGLGGSGGEVAAAGGSGDDGAPDFDGDGVPDTIDPCPLDPGKTYPGECGCGYPDTDADGDGLIYCEDPCPNLTGATSDTDGDGVCDGEDECLDDPNKSEPGQCGCGMSDADANGNGVADCNDPPPNNCACDSGPCCDGCNFRDSTHQCGDEMVVATWCGGARSYCGLSVTSVLNGATSGVLGCQLSATGILSA